MYDVEGTLLRKIKLLRINDLALTRDGTVMVTVNQEKLIKVQRLTDSRDVRARPALAPFLTCFSPDAENVAVFAVVGVAAYEDS